VKARIFLLRCVVRSAQGAVPVSPPARFPGPPARTRRAALTAPGAPRALPAGQPPVAGGCWSGVHGVNLVAAVTVSAHSDAGCAGERNSVGQPAGGGLFFRPAMQLGLHVPYRAVAGSRCGHCTALEFTSASSGIACLLDWPAAALGPAPGSPGLHGGSLLPRLLRRLRPTRAFGRRRAYPRAPVPDGRCPWNGHGWFPRSLLSGRRVRHPALPLRPRHGYCRRQFTAASHPRPQRPGQEFPAPSCGTGAHRTPAPIRRI
jgi:hypothetical protein